ncbi:MULTISPECIES: hypothetical protein [Cupriavidus]|uniref:hypothetical protein n=1 Tax=Cupriavidus TaxID=106589 RepID=UPI0002A22D80|nr:MULTISPECIES: hypothetical protein [Cupriavidus]EKZ99952.1 hypothetical protein D769_07428 [Cupriavidus sp. HMR-1]QWC89302.1 hypothetical protein KB891_03605 [Cupriavidus metallidurans]
MPKQQTLQIIAIIPFRGTSRKTGNAFEMFQAQCIVQTHGVDQETGEAIPPFVGVMTLAKHLKDTAPGMYEADFDLIQGRDNSVAASICSLRSVAPRANPKPGAGPGAEAKAA